MRLLIELTYGRCECRTCERDRRQWRELFAGTALDLANWREFPPPICLHPEPVATCRTCGCWDLEACEDEDYGACYWVEPDLCSACADPETLPEPQGFRLPQSPAEWAALEGALACCGENASTQGVGGGRAS